MKNNECCKGKNEPKCCGSNDCEETSYIQNTDYSCNEDYIIGSVTTNAGSIPQVSTTLKYKDNLGTLKCRFGIYRMNYKVNPGLYCVGKPDSESPVLVTANYKMTFDMLRKELGETNAWILVLDTKGVNVWCAAGKGTFGTDELVRRIKAVNLSSVISHKTIILPQLGAPGVEAHEVLKLSGFRVVYGPVRACDVPIFLSQGLCKTEEMRTMKFTLIDRIVLIPMEFILSFRVIAIVLAAYLILGYFGIIPMNQYGYIPYIGAILTGCIIVPIALPWIPGKAFAVKGFVMGMAWVTVLIIFDFLKSGNAGLQNIVAYILILPSLTAFISMNFTGASTYTSLSGVLKELKIFVPVIISLSILGVVFLILQHYFIQFI